MQLAETPCPVCKGAGQTTDTRQIPTAVTKCGRCGGLGKVHHFEVLLEQILSELKIANSKKR